MRKFLFVSLLAFSFLCGYTQNYEVLHIEDVSNTFVSYCSNDEDLLGVIIYGINCPNQKWTVYDFTHDIYIIQDVCADSIIIDKTITFTGFEVHYNCDETYSCDVYFVAPICPFPEQIVWKRLHEQITLDCNSHEGIWSTGEVGRFLTVSEQGTYYVTLPDSCGSATYSVDVLNILEIYRATVDLASGLNKITWQTTPEQAEYIQSVKAIRDGYFEVGIAPYDRGYIFDNIGSDNASRNYTLIGILYDGTECPIESYEIGTPHVDYSPNANDPNKINMAWTKPFIEEGAPTSVTYFLICRFDPVTHEVTVVDQLAPNNTIGSYNRDLFDGGYAALGVLYDDGSKFEERLGKYTKGVTMSLEEFDDVSFSNPSDDIILAVGEQQAETFEVYPNPNKGRFTVEGTGILHITNVLGQEITAKEIDGKETMELLQGMYFVKLGGATRKIVVE